MSVIAAFFALLQWTTILPSGRSADFEEFAKRSYLYPVAGYLIGGMAAIPLLIIPDSLAAAAVALGILFLVSGCNHFDGLLDMGDGLMAHGSREARTAHSSTGRWGPAVSHWGLPSPSSHLGLLRPLHSYPLRF